LRSKIQTGPIRWTSFEAISSRAQNRFAGRSFKYAAPRIFGSRRQSLSIGAGRNRARARNNIDIAIQRYGPFLVQEVLRRTQGGGGLRNVSQPIAPGPSSVSLAGVSAGNIGLPNGGSGVSSGGGLVITLGETPPIVDPLFLRPPISSIPLFRSAIPFWREFLSTGRQQIVPNWIRAIVRDRNVRAACLRQHAQQSQQPKRPVESFYERIPGSVYHAKSAARLRNRRQQSLRARGPEQYEGNRPATEAAGGDHSFSGFESLLDLVSFNEDVRIKEQALNTAQKLYEGNQHQAELGTLPKIEVTRAAAEVSSTKENLLIAQTNVAQQETVLKNALSRNGVASPWLDEVHIIPLDKIVVPNTEDIKSNAELIAHAIENRPELEQARINLESNKMNLIGTKNSLLPTLQAFVDLTSNGLTGPPNRCPMANSLQTPSLWVAIRIWWASFSVVIFRATPPASLSTSHFEIEPRRPTTLPTSSPCGRASCNFKKR